MSGIIGTNVTADGAAEYEFINKILTALENKYLAANKTEEAKNAKIIADHIGKGGQGSYKLIEKRLEEPIKKALKAKKIPFSVIYDNRGNAAFVVRDIDEDAFTKIQHDVFAMDTQYYAQVTTKELCRIAKNNNEKDLITLSFKTEEDFQEAQTKLYGSGVVCSVDKRNWTLYVNSADLYNAQGSDLTTFELEWAANQSMNDEMFGGNPSGDEGEKDSEIQMLRNIQAKHDMEMIKAFSKAVQKGENKVILNANNASSTYMECGHDGLHICRQDTMGIWKDVAYFTRDDIKNMEPEAVGAVVSKFGFDIHDKIVIDAAEKDNILKATREEATAWSENWVAEVNENGMRPLVGKDFPRQLRPDNLLGGRSLEADRLKKTKLKNVLSAAEKEARNRVEAKNVSSHITPSEKRKLLKEEIGAILLAKRLPEIEQFLEDEDNGFSRDEKEKWLNNIQHHFMDEQEESIHELTITNSNIKELEKQISKQDIEKAREKAGEKDQKTPAEISESADEIDIGNKGEGKERAGV